MKLRWRKRAWPAKVWIPGAALLLLAVGFVIRSTSTQQAHSSAVAPAVLAEQVSRTTSPAAVTAPIATTSTSAASVTVETTITSSTSTTTPLVATVVTSADVATSSTTSTVAVADAPPLIADPLVVSRGVDLSIGATVIGPVAANRLATVAVTVANAGPAVATSPEIIVNLPPEWTDVALADTAWSCSSAGRLLTCSGPNLVATGSTRLVLRGVLSSETVLKSAGARPRNFAPAPVVFAVSDNAVGSVERDDSTNRVEVSFGSVPDRGPATLTSRTLHGGLVMAANSLLDCDPATPTCQDALVRGDNGNAVMSARISSAGALVGTTASSSASLQIPIGATVSEAYVAWGAVSMDGSDLPRNGLAVAWLSGPNLNATRVSPALQQSTGANDFYARADVTDVVRGQGSGVYGFGLVGGLADVHGANQSAGWALVVVYENASEPMRSVLVADGLSVMGGGPAINVALGDDRSLSSGAKRAELAVVAFDGDRAQADLMCLNGVRLRDATHPSSDGPCDQLFPTDDVLGGIVANHGTVTTGSENTLGFDASVINTSVPGSQASTLTVLATGDVVRVGLIGLVVDQ